MFSHGLKSRGTLFPLSCPSHKSIIPFVLFFFYMKGSEMAGNLKFDNAFLQKNGNVGMQFIDAGRIVHSVWKDERGIHTSEHSTPAQSAYLVAQYHRRQGWYKKAA